MNHEFYRVATFELEDGNQYAVFCAEMSDEDGSRSYLLVRPDGSIFKGGRLGVLKRVFDAIRDLEPAVFEDESEPQPQFFPARAPYHASTVIDAVEYDEGTKVLGVRLYNGTLYEYGDVPVEKYWGLLAAPSPGYYWNRYIKDEHDRVDKQEWAPF